VDPKQLKFAETHEWAYVEGNIATIGISSHAVEQLTDLVFMDLPAVGATVAAGTSFGEVESVKATSDLYCPVDGEVVEVNSTLPDNLDLLNSDPYGAGWIIKVKLSGTDAIDNLMDYDTYEKQCADHG
jgi:glycine cleavage system H protein